MDTTHALSNETSAELIKVAIQLHWFLWPPRYVKLVYRPTDALKEGHANAFDGIQTNSCFGEKKETSVAWG